LNRRRATLTFLVPIYFYFAILINPYYIYPIIDWSNYYSITFHVFSGAIQ